LSRDVLSQLCRINGENDDGAERNNAIAGFQYSFLSRLQRLPIFSLSVIIL
jgi:hypothetical protein